MLGDRYFIWGVRECVKRVKRQVVATFCESLSLVQLSTTYDMCREDR